MADELRICDWSSDVCSADLTTVQQVGGVGEGLGDRLPRVGEVPSGHGASVRTGRREHTCPSRDRPRRRIVPRRTRGGNVRNRSFVWDSARRSGFEHRPGDLVITTHPSSSRSEAPTSELKSLMLTSYAVLCMKK